MKREERMIEFNGILPRDPKKLMEVLSNYRKSGLERALDSDRWNKIFPKKIEFELKD